jgi:hypothetical protein
MIKGAAPTPSLLWRAGNGRQRASGNMPFIGQLSVGASEKEILGHVSPFDGSRLNRGLLPFRPHALRISGRRVFRFWLGRVYAAVSAGCTRLLP